MRLSNKFSSVAERSRDSVGGRSEGGEGAGGGNSTAVEGGRGGGAVELF